MPRPRKDQINQHRLPTWHTATRRWRLRIEHAHGTKEFYWPAQARTELPPPAVIAAAVAVQDQWKGIVEDWHWISKAMKLEQPDKDWSRPVWVDVAKAQAVVDRVATEERELHQKQRVHVLHHVALYGIQDLLATALEPGVLCLDGSKHPRLTTERPDLLAKINAEREQMRLQLLSELAPARAMISQVTVREALLAYIQYHHGRTQLKAGDWIEDRTYQMLRRRVLAVLGLSSGPVMKVIRQVPIDLEARLVSLNRDHLEALARFWHRKPEGVKSETTLKGYLIEARAFFRWCENKYDGFRFPNDVAKLFTAQSVKTPAEPYNAERLRKILRQGKSRGGERLKMYTLLGLLLGYGPTDCTQIANDEYFVEGADHFIQRFRSKERRPKRGSRPLRVKHWVAPELARMMDRNRRVNAQGYLFNTDGGTVLTTNAISKLWERAVTAAQDDLAFKQLRKIGYNRIKHHARSREVAELWDGHSGGVADHYDDGLFLPVIEAQQKFAEELRADGVL